MTAELFETATTQEFDEYSVLETLLEGISSSVGEEFFRALVKSLAEALGTHSAMVTVFDRDCRTARALALWSQGDWVDDFCYSIVDTPCEAVIDEQELYHYPDHLMDLFPGDHQLQQMGFVSYLGVPLHDADGAVFGNLAVVDKKPMPCAPRCIGLFRLFANRAAAEYQRLQAEEGIRQRERLLVQPVDEEAPTSHSSSGLVGESPTFLKILQTLDRVAQTDATVLIGGETGTGKEVIARAIHAASRRADESLVCVNCAAIPSSLIESEFFGHVQGAFTGATEKRDGRFAHADGGTLFLDEVGELPLDMQGKLLRVLQEGEFEPVGSSETKRVDVRIVAATNRDLAEEVKQSRFREDLFYRLNVFPLTLPPLRERGNDVLLLSDHFAKTIGRSMDRAYTGLTEQCEQRLLAHTWPGNIRELRNVIERALITSTSGRLDLAGAFSDGVSAQSFRELFGGGNEPARVLTEDEMRELERRNIRQALKVCDWKVSGDGGAAELLGIKPSTLSSRIKTLGIERD